MHLKELRPKNSQSNLRVLFFLCLNFILRLLQNRPHHLHIVQGNK